MGEAVIEILIFFTLTIAFIFVLNLLYASYWNYRTREAKNKELMMKWEFNKEHRKAYPFLYGSNPDYSGTFTTCAGTGVIAKKTEDEH